MQGDLILYQKVNLKAGERRPVSFTVICHPFPTLPASHFHYLMCIVCRHFICFFLFCMGVEYLHWNPFCFCFHPVIAPPPPPPFSPTQAASQSKAQKKLQPLAQVPVLQEQGEYCAGVGVWTWVPAVWLRGVVVLFSVLSPFMLQFCLSTSIFPLTSRDGVCEMAPLSSLSHCPRETLHMQSRHQAGDVGFSLVCLCICLWAPEEYSAVCAASCACVCVCARIHTRSWPY